MCTWVDDNGILHVCNELCENCSQCEKSSIDPLDPLPSGWFWLSNGSNAGCNNSSCKPHLRWGIGSTQSDVTWDFPLRVKTFESQGECQENDDLQITFQTFSDGGAGCWEDPVGECLIDRKQLGPLWEINCDIPPGVIADQYPESICSNDVASITVSIEDGTVYPVFVTFIENPEVHGLKEYTFESGYGTIRDTLKILNPYATEPVEVTYIAQVLMPGMICNGTTDTFKVTINPLPKLSVQADIPELSCNDLPYNLNLEINSGNSEGYIFDWVDSISGKTGIGKIIQLDKTFGHGFHVIKVRVTDSTGCFAYSNYYANLNINVDTSVTKSENTLASNLSGAQYQWLNCYAGYAKIIGETGQSFTPIINGSFAVEVTKDGCIDTSSCHKVIITGLLENTFGDKLTVYPNPTGGKINIEFGEVLSKVEIILTDVAGKEIMKKHIKNTSFMDLEIEGKRGAYFIRIRSGEKYALVKLVKQ